jgi:hypothetical protein
MYEFELLKKVSLECLQALLEIMENSLIKNERKNNTVDNQINRNGPGGI